MNNQILIRSKILLPWMETLLAVFLEKNGLIFVVESKGIKIKKILKRLSHTHFREALLDFKVLQKGKYHVNQTKRLQPAHRRIRKLKIVKDIFNYQI